MEGGSLWHEFETDLPAADVWEVYGGLALGQLVPQLLPQVLSKVELVEGDGGAGTVLLVTFPPAASEPRSYKEKFNVVDDEKYIKEAETVEGGFLDLGFRKYVAITKHIKEQKKSPEQTPEGRCSHVWGWRWRCGALVLAVLGGEAVAAMDLDLKLEAFTGVLSSSTGRDVGVLLASCSVARRWVWALGRGKPLTGVAGHDVGNARGAVVPLATPAVLLWKVPAPSP
ncbi:S-norcoclaurine synthase [Triticum urartu]|uniref:S-norcoclaurine synthase n=1 Tax=Triticum urartu TaxID=4572 RepID=M8AAI1_TRIUA|nr:S-norcoclaurine synthase [Triticum urartu]